MLLSMPLDHIKGVGEKTFDQLKLAGLNTVGDIIDFFPRTYEDFTAVTAISDIRPGKVTVKAKVSSINTRVVRRGMRITTATLSDDTGKIKAVWFNQPYRETQLKTGEEFLFSGDFTFQYNQYQLMTPSAEKASDFKGNADKIVPIYRAVKGLKSQIVRGILEQLKPTIATLPETLPDQIVAEEKLDTRAQALLKLHFPNSSADVEAAKKRLAFEELLPLLLASQLNRQDNASLKGWTMPFDVNVVKSFVAALPFKLTNAQRVAAWDIVQDFEKETPMNRLLQGDVGSGKTVVAGLAARQAAHAGFQTAIMAPTEILANQHVQTLVQLLEPFGVRVGLLTGRVKGKARQLLLDAIKSGDVDVVVGTHALIQSTVNFYKLGFVVIDEQHRFGVAQRQALLTKSERMPHLLSMSATPIPRSLALTVYGELDISILNERPKNRKEIETHIWSPNSRKQLYEKVESELLAGRQAYIICSLIDNNPQNELKSVEAEHKRLQAGAFKHRRIGLLHGKLSSQEKSDVMLAFAAGKLDILVSTTVVEVGVDVPNATVIVIEDADRFGLAQLHQLRGRVGRSELQSYCYLVMSDSSKPTRRLREIEASNDGFYLAEVDLQLRGPGEIYGRAQHGALNLQIASLADSKMIVRAKKSAEKIVKNMPDLSGYPVLKQQVEYYQRLTTLN